MELNAENIYLLALVRTLKQENDILKEEKVATLEKLHDAEQRLQKSLQQIVVIDSQIRELEILYKRAQKSKKNASTVKKDYFEPRTRIYRGVCRILI